MNNTEAIEEEIAKLTNVIKLALDKSTIKHKINFKKPPINSETSELISTRNKLRKMYQINRNPIIHQQIKALGRQISQNIKEIKAACWVNKIKKLSVNDNSLWSMCKILTSNKDDMFIQKLHGEDGLDYSEKGKANILARQYFRQHTITEHLSDPETERAINISHREAINNPSQFPDGLIASTAEINSIRSRLKAGKAPGHDGITNMAIKHLPKIAVTQLLFIYNSCLKHKHFPQTWKEAIILPFHKPGKDKLFAANYRPISLLPTLGKMLEIIILNRLKMHEKKHNIFIPEQFGFKKHHSTTLQLGRIINSVTQNFNINKSTALVTLDIEKAFDTVWHKALIHKLKINNFPLYLIQLVNSFLKIGNFA